MTMHLFDTARSVLENFQSRLEATMEYSRSEIEVYTKPCMMGKSGLSLNFETASGLALSACFWESGILEMATNMVPLPDDEPYFLSYVPEDWETGYYPEESMVILHNAIIRFFDCLAAAYPRLD